MAGCRTSQFREDQVIMAMYDCLRIRFVSLPLLAVWVALPSMSLGQDADREALVEPTYRVSKSTDTTRSLPLLDSEISSINHAAADTSATGVDPLSSTVTGANEPEATSKLPAASDHDAPNEQNTLSEPERIFSEVMIDAAAMLNYIQTNVDDYTCTFVKRENVKGHVIGPQYISAKVRNRRVENGEVIVPFSIYMKFLKPNSIKGREALYVEGENGGKFWAKEGGTAGRLLPAVLLPVDGRLAMRDNRYPITEFGIENLTARLLERGQADRNIHDCIVTYRDGAKVCDRPCKMMEVRRPTPKVGKDAEYGMNVFIAQVFIDSELNVPMRYAAYTWPSSPGSPPEVVEEYTYQDLQLNVGLTTADFDHRNPEYGF